MKLTVSMGQMRVVRRDPEANIAKARELVREAVTRGSRLVCFPEMWTTGFDWEWNTAHAAEQANTIARVAELAREFKMWINGSMLALNGNGKPANASILFSPAGEQVAVYRKIHLFGLFQEQKHVAPGEGMATGETDFGRVGLSVCYDLRFPELFRSYAVAGVQVQLLPSAFPQPRLEHWRVLIRARAIEDQMFMIATNQVGDEQFGPDDTATYFGSSTIADPWGRVIVEGTQTEEQVLTATIDLDEVQQVRSRFSVLTDRRPDLY